MRAITQSMLCPVFAFASGAPRAIPNHGCCALRSICESYTWRALMRELCVLIAYADYTCKLVQNVHCSVVKLPGFSGHGGQNRFVRLMIEIFFGCGRWWMFLSSQVFLMPADCEG